MIRASLLDPGYRASFTNGELTSIADMPIAKGGDGQGFGPHELIEAALATCIAITARQYAGDHQIPLVSAQCEVRIDRSNAAAVAFDYRLTMEGDLTLIQERNLRDAVSRCPVARTLTGLVTLRSSD
jgi:putative redox protein